MESYAGETRAHALRRYKFFWTIIFSQSPPSPTILMHLAAACIDRRS